MRHNTEDKELLRDFLTVYLPEVGFSLKGPDAEATEDEIEDLIEDYFRDPKAAA